MPEELQAPVETDIYEENGNMSEVWWIFLTSLGVNASDLDPTFDSVALGNLTPERLTASDSAKKIVSVEDFTVWVNGTALEVEITDNGDGTITVGLPDNVTIANDLTVGNDVSAVNDVEAGNDVTAVNNIEAGVDLTAGQDADIGRNLDVANDANVENDLTIKKSTFHQENERVYYDGV